MYCRYAVVDAKGAARYWTDKKRDVEWKAVQLAQTEGGDFLVVRVLKHTAVQLVENKR